MSSLRDLVFRWHALHEQGPRRFKETLDAINRELDAVGGYATTRPDEKGYCRTYERRSDSFGGGVVKVGRDTNANVHPQVGDRCFEIETAWRSEREAEARARQDVLDALGGKTDPAQVAWEILKDL